MVGYKPVNVSNLLNKINFIFVLFLFGRLILTDNNSQNLAYLPQSLTMTRSPWTVTHAGHLNCPILTFV